MFSLSADLREKNKIKKGKIKDNFIPAVLYGPEIKEPQLIKVNLSDFKKIYEQAGESSLISLKVKDKQYLVLVHEMQRDPVSNEFIHIDFYQPNLKKEVEVSVPIIFEGESPAVKELGGTLIKEIQEIEVRALPQKLPHEIKVNIEKLKNFEDAILVKDLVLPEGVEVIKEPDEIIANISAPIKEEEIKEEEPAEEAEVSEADKEQREKDKEAFEAGKDSNQGAVEGESKESKK